MPIRIAIADDSHFLISAVAEKISFFADLETRLTATDGLDLIDKLSVNRHIDLILMDIQMPVLNGIAATSRIKSKYPQIKILMLTVFDDDENIFNSIKAGADGYLLKDIDPASLHSAIIETINGGAAMTPSIALKTLKLLINPISSRHNFEDISLSKREIEVLEQLSKGLTYSAIAENLYIAPSTVRKHLENIYVKLQVHSKLEAVEKAKRNNLI